MHQEMNLDSLPRSFTPRVQTPGISGACLRLCACDEDSQVLHKQCYNVGILILFLERHILRKQFQGLQMLAKGISNFFKIQVNVVKGKNNSKCIAVNSRFFLSEEPHLYRRSCL